MSVYKNNYPRWVIKQILTQVEKQQEKNMKNNNNDDSNTNNENGFTNENNRCLKSSFHSLHYHTKGNKVKKFLNPSRQL